MATLYPGGGGGGGGHSPHDWMHPCPPKKQRKGCFSDIGVNYFFLKFFFFHCTLGVPGIKNVRSLIQNAIFGYHFSAP